MIGACWPYARGRTSTAVFYAGYIARIRDGEWLARLEQQPDEYRVLLAGLDEARAAAPTAPGKWSVIDILGHVCDTERVFGFRLIWFARGAPSELPGFDQDAWVEAARRQPRTLADSLDEFAQVRQATLAMLRTVSDEDALSPWRRQWQSDHGASLRLDDRWPRAAPPRWTPRALG